MSVKKEEIIRAYKLVTKFIERLDEEKLSKWLDGKMKLTLQEVDSTKKIKTEDIETLIVYENQLNNIRNYEEADIYLKQLKLGKQQLKELALKLGVHIKSRDTKEGIIQKIIEETIGTKLKIEILSNKKVKIVSN